MSSLRFDAKQHRYFLEGNQPGDVVELPSVTTVLKETNMIDMRHIPQDVLDHAGARGTAVHTALHYLDEGDLDESTVDPTIAGYIVAYQKFCRDTGFYMDRVENRLYHPTMLYAGTLDRTGWFNERTRIIVDFKTGIVYPGHALQLAAYAQCLPESRSYRRIALKLNDDGTYKAHEFPMGDYLRDSQLFNAALACHRFQFPQGAKRQ